MANVATPAGPMPTHAATAGPKAGPMPTHAATAGPKPHVATTAGRLIGEIRSRSGVSQAELARRAGLTRSVLNAYERGHREPGANALARIAAAAGLELRLESPAAQPELARAGRILVQVLDLAEALPQKRRGALRYPSLRALAP